MNQKWSEKTTLQKVMEIIAGIAFLVYLIFSLVKISAIDNTCFPIGDLPAKVS